MKNQLSQRFTAEAIFRSCNKHGGLYLPCRPGFLVRPYPFSLRR